MLRESAAGESSGPAVKPEDSKREPDEAPRKSNSWRPVEPVEAKNGPENAALSAHPVSDSDDSEEGEIRIKDLDTGKEYNIPKKNTIRDLNTGQMYALCTENGVATDSLKHADSEEHFTDFTSGKQLSLEEFQIALGLQRKDNPHSASGHSDVASGGKKGDAAGFKSKISRKKLGWLKRIPFGKSSPAAESEGSETESNVSSPQVGEGLSRISGGASVRVQVHRKLHKDLAGLSRVQTLQAHKGVVWAMKFSHSGRYLATAGQDGIVHVWEVAEHRGLPSPGADATPPQDSTSNGHKEGKLEEEEGAVFKAAPHRTYCGHKQDVLDLAWSKSLFLLTASMDKTVRLWHVSMDDCLRVFRHTDFVTALDFHPVDDKHFVSGSIDGKVRLWNIPEQNGRVVDYADVHDMVTAATFSADGRRAVVGTMKGKCRFYQCSPAFKLEYEAQIDVKNRRGNSARGRKITGLQFQPDNPNNLLITSNDSRIRLYEGYTLRCKYKGLQNTNTQIRASFSEHGEYIICGSDDGSVYFWTTAIGGRADACGNTHDDGAKQEKSGSYECFNAHADIATVAIFAPDAARRPLARTSPSISSKVAGATESMSRLGLRGKLSKEDASVAAAAGEAAIAAAKAYGQVLLTAGYDGEIKVFENLLPPHWL